MDVSELRGFSEGIVEPRPHDRIDNPPDYLPWAVGRIPRFLRPDALPDIQDLLGMAVPAAILELVAEWSGLRRKDLARRLKRSRNLVIDPVVNEMLAGEWLQEVGGMLYLARTGVLHVARRDRVSPDTVWARVNAAIKQDHRPVGPHRRHTIVVNEVMVHLHENGITAYAGWRAVQNLADTQLAPDLVIFAHSVFGMGVYYIEVERTARHPEQVADKSNPWLMAFQAGGPTRVIFIVEQTEVEGLFQALGNQLPLFTSSLRDVRSGPLRGDDTVWRLRGRPVPLW